MPTYVLIWIVITHYNNENHNLPQSVATHSQEFIGQTACEDAKRNLALMTHELSNSVRRATGKPPREAAMDPLVQKAFSTEATVIAECFRKDSR